MVYHCSYSLVVGSKYPVYVLRVSKRQVKKIVFIIQTHTATLLLTQKYLRGLNRRVLKITRRVLFDSLLMNFATCNLKIKFKKRYAKAVDLANS